MNLKPEALVRSRALALFRQQQSELAELLPWARIEHVGSTAVPGSITKGDLDIAVHVSLEDFERSERALARRYSRNPGSDRTEDFAAFLDETTELPLGIQLVVEGSSADHFTSWRDRLLGDRRLLQEFNALKRRHEGRDLEEYRSAKAEFIEANQPGNKRYQGASG